MEPSFRRRANGVLVLEDSKEARSRPRHTTAGYSEPLDKVRRDAVAAVRDTGGDPSNPSHVLGQHRMQMGQYRGQTFQWILDNVTGYAGWFVDGMRNERHSSTPLSDSKHAFKDYVLLFPEGKEAVQMKETQRLAKETQRLAKMVRLQQSRIAVRPNIPPRVHAPDPDTHSDETLCAEADKLEQSLFAAPCTRVAKPRPSRPLTRPGIPSKTATPTPAAHTRPRVTSTEVLGVSKTPSLLPSRSSPSLAPAARKPTAVRKGHQSGTAIRPVTHTVAVQSTEQAPTVNVLRTAEPLPSTSGTSVSPAPADNLVSPVPATGYAVATVVSTVAATARTLASALQSPAQEYPIPHGWLVSLPEVDHQWISKAIFSMSAQGLPELDMRKVNKLWWYPPQPQLMPGSLPRADRYFSHRLLLWMPRKLWHAKLNCPHCQEHDLTSSGLYRCTRLVLDIDSYYNLAAETMKCSLCRRNFISWNQPLLEQLDYGHRLQFPVVLTYRRACDIRVIRLLRQRGLGNSPSQLEKKLVEQHNEAWTSKTIQYLTDCHSFVQAGRSRLLVAPNIPVLPDQIPVPKYQWLQSVYCQDVMGRLEEVKASITTTFGRVLKMDSTKKITKKLAGDAASTAAWATNISNEHGAVLMSVLTASEGHGLDPMVRGIILRYKDAGVPPPDLLYVDCECCGQAPISDLFTASWPDLAIRLDVWHYMRRFAVAVTTDTHRLYGSFMSQLSHCIFVWDKDDLALLKQAKRSEMLLAHVSDPSEEDVIRRITRKEMSLHCRRSTRGADVMTQLIGQMLEMFDSEKGHDTMGVPLLHHERIWEIWKTQKRHVVCLQDPPGFALYTRTGTLKKGGMELPVFRCARGSTSLESFHCHMQRFIPANATHFQAYLVEGLARWNADRNRAAVSTDPDPTCYSGIMCYTANKLGEGVLGQKVFPNYQEPRKYTGENIGIEYLYSQTGKVLHDTDSVVVDDTNVPNTADIDEGFEDEPLDDPTVPLVDTLLAPQTIPETVPVVEAPAPAPILPLLSEAAYKAMLDSRPSLHHVTPPSIPPPAAASPFPVTRPLPIPETTTTDPVVQDSPIKPSGDSVGPENVQGFARVDALAAYLVSLNDQESMALDSNQVAKVISLWDNLVPFDKSPTKWSPRHKKELIQGRFKPSKTKRIPAMPGVESVKRCFLGPNAGPAQWPDCNRYVEAIMTKLCLVFPGQTTVGGRRQTRWTLVMRAYNKIYEMVLGNKTVMLQTKLQLPMINQKTLTQWYNQRDKRQEKEILEQGLSLHTQPAIAPQQLPPPVEKPHTLPVGTDTTRHTFILPDNKAGQGQVRRRILPPPTTISIQPIQPSDVLMPTTCPAPQPQQTPAEPPVPYSTKHYRKRKLEKEQAGMPTRAYVRTSSVVACTKCDPSEEDVTTQLIVQMLKMFDSEKGHDTMVVPLLHHERLWEIWKVQQRHIACLQDPPGVPLYTKTNPLKKGGVELLIYRCVHGSTSLVIPRPLAALHTREESTHHSKYSFTPGADSNGQRTKKTYMDYDIL